MPGRVFILGAGASREDTKHSVLPMPLANDFFLTEYINTHWHNPNYGYKYFTGDFSVSTTTCSTNLAAKSTCTISVVFTPTQTGTRTGTLQVSDSAAGSPQISTLTGTGK